MKRLKTKSKARLTNNTTNVLSKKIVKWECFNTTGYATALEPCKSFDLMAENLMNPNIWKFGHWNIWKIGNLDLWKFVHLEIWIIGYLDIGTFGYWNIWIEILTFGNLEIWIFGHWNIYKIGYLDIWTCENLYSCKFGTFRYLDIGTFGHWYIWKIGNSGI